MHWVAGPGYAGPVLIRGRQLDGQHTVRFPAGHGYASEARFPLQTGDLSPGIPPDWRLLPSAIGVQAPGCYGLQVDGPDFTRLIVFEVIP
jgi:hypothetical protein